MIVHWVMLISVYLLSVIGCFFKKKNITGYKEVIELENQQKTISLFFALVSMTVIVFFVGERTYYGDTYLYIENFKALPTNFNYIKTMWSDKDENILFWTIALIIKKYVSTDYTVWFFFLAIFQAGAIVKLYRTYSVDFSFSIYLFVAAGGVMNWMMNGVKQFTAACLVLYFFDRVINRKFISFLIVVILAYFIHKTAILWIPIYFITKFKPFSWKIWICVAVTLLAVIFVDRFTDILNDSLEGTKYAGNDITQYDDGFDNGVNPIRVLVYAVPPAIALWRRKIVDEYSDPIIDICINTATVSVGVYLIGVVTSGVLIGRVPIYFELPNYILLPWLIEKTFLTKQSRIIKAFAFLSYSAYFYYIIAVQDLGHYSSTILKLYY